MVHLKRLLFYEPPLALLLSPKSCFQYCYLFVIWEQRDKNKSLTNCIKAMKLVWCQWAWPWSSPALEEDNKFSEIASTKTSGSLQPPSTWSKWLKIYQKVLFLWIVGKTYWTYDGFYIFIHCQNFSEYKILGWL